VQTALRSHRRLATLRDSSETTPPPKEPVEQVTLALTHPQPAPLPASEIYSKPTQAPARPFPLRRVALLLVLLGSALLLYFQRRHVDRPAVEVIPVDEPAAEETHAAEPSPKAAPPHKRPHPKAPAPKSTNPMELDFK
jgi:hypothetical protein